MKKRIFTVLLLFVALMTSVSANAKLLGLGIGPKAGMTFNSLDINKGFADSDNRCGFTVGATAEYIAPLGIGADISLMYAHMETGKGDEKVKGDFIEIPLHLKYKLSLPVISKILKPYVFTGPSVAVKVSDAKSFANTKTGQWGWDLGLGLEFINHLQLGAGYSFGLNNVAPKYYEDFGVKVKSNYWSVTLAWMF